MAEIEFCRHGDWVQNCKECRELLKQPVFYGHYWWEGVPHELEDWTAHTACVDCSAVKGGTLVAYRWDGEQEIDPGHFHPARPDLVRPTPSA